MTSEHPARLVIGIGNRDRGDDDAGRAVIRFLSGTLPADVCIAEHDGETSGLLERLGSATAAILIDACRSGAPAGTVRRFDVAATRLPATAFSLSSHGLGLAEAIELARALGQLPRSCVVYAIEGQSFALGAPLSPPVATAVAALAAQLRSEFAG